MFHTELLIILGNEILFNFVFKIFTCTIHQIFKMSEPLSIYACKYKYKSKFLYLGQGIKQ